MVINNSDSSYPLSSLFYLLFLLQLIWVISSMTARNSKQYATKIKNKLLVRFELISPLQECLVQCTSCFSNLSAKMLCWWDLEYADYIPCRGLRTLPHKKNKCFGYDTKLHLMVKVKFCKYKECEILFYCIYSLFYFNPVLTCYGLIYGSNRFV